MKQNNLLQTFDYLIAVAKVYNNCCRSEMINIVSLKTIHKEK
jgi:hypothetical protein